MQTKNKNNGKKNLGIVVGVVCYLFTAIYLSIFDLHNLFPAIKFILFSITHKNRFMEIQCVLVNGIFVFAFFFLPTTTAYNQVENYFTPSKHDMLKEFYKLLQLA